MNDEIKEILDKLDYLVKNEMCWWENYTVFSPKDTKVLLDYITNLQQENHDLKSKLECYENGLYFSSEVDNLQRKLDKAIDYVEKHTIEETKEIDIFANADILLNILQNGDDK